MPGFSIPETAQRRTAGPVVLDLTGPVLPMGVGLARVSTATRIDASGNIVVMANDTARFDHDPISHAPSGVLGEPAATNLVTAAVATTASWTALNCVVNQLSLNVLGVFPGVDVAGMGAVWHRMQVPTGGWNSGAPQRIAVWYKAGSSGKAFVNLRNQTAGVESSLAGMAGAIGSNGNVAGPFSNIVNQDLGGGHYLVKATFTPNAAATNGWLGIGPYSTVSGESIIVLGAQFEAGTETTSLILSSGSSASRAADVITLTNWTGTYDITIAYSDGAAETRMAQVLSPGFVLTPLAHRHVVSLTLA